MNRRIKKWGLVFTLATAVVVATLWSQEKVSVPTVPVSMLVSVEAKHGKDIPTIYREDVRVFQGRDRLKVQEWVPFQGDQAGLELFMLIDDSSDSSLGLQMDDLRKFIHEQPPTTTIAVGYIRNGFVDIVQNFTADHSLAGKALRLPLGSAGGVASPYLVITDLIKRWPQSSNRREIFLVSSGIDALQPGPTNSYLDEAIEHAQRAEIQIYSIYAARSGHFGHTFWRFQWGQNNLSRLADETGGEAYFQALETPIAFAPYLDQFGSRLQHQFKLTFLAKPKKESGYQKVRLETEVPNAELVAAERVYVPAAR
jgi:hypothetical protein